MTTNVTTNREGITIQQVAHEFITAMQQMPTGGDDIAALAQHFCQLEKTQPDAPSVIEMVKNMHGSGANGYDSAFLVHCQPRITNMLLSCCAMQVGQIPELFTTMVGLYAVEFYSQHPRTQELTFKWVLDLVGGFKLINFTMMEPWALYCRNAEQQNILEVITPELLYTYIPSDADSQVNPTNLCSTAELQRVLDAAIQTNDPGNTIDPVK